MSDRRQDAVDQLTAMLERDQLEIDRYRELVDRVLAATTEDEVTSALARIEPPAAPASPALVLRCRSGVMDETPGALPSIVELVCESGVMKVDLSRAVIDDALVDVEVTCESGVMVVTFPRNAVVQVESQDNDGGVFKNKLARRGRADPDSPRIFVHVRNGRGVLKLRHPWWGRR
ncbi:MAG TPA: hypothetical protein VEA78_02655 [Acidimicrobiales bacterium]|nr:hypothetical protein [Acidimicrobiales bacterium]